MSNPLSFGSGEFQRVAAASSRLYGQSGGGSGGQQTADCRSLTIGLGLLTASQRVDDRVLDERSEHEDQTRRHPDVDRLGEGPGRHAAQQSTALRGDGQDGQDAEGRACRRRLQVDPERQPRQQNDQKARQVGRQDVGSKSTLEVKVGAQAREIACNSSD